MDSDKVWKCDLCYKYFQYKSEIRNHLKLHSDLGGIYGLNINNTMVITEEPHENVKSGSTNIPEQKQYKERKKLKINKLRSELMSDAQNGKKLQKNYYNEDFEKALKAALGNFKPWQSKYFKYLDKGLYKCAMCPYVSIRTSGLWSHQSTWHKPTLSESKTVSLLDGSCVSEAKLSTSFRDSFKSVFSFEENTDLNDMVNSMLTRTDGLWTCTKCGKTNTDKSKAKRHIETHVEGVSHPCGFCGKNLRSRNCLQAHISRSHTTN